jgi:hypothetical protein
MDVQTDERLLINIEGYLIELVCNVESMDELNLVAEALVSVQDALRPLGPRANLQPDPGGKLLMVVVSPLHWCPQARGLFRLRRYKFYASRN